MGRKINVELDFLKKNQDERKKRKKTNKGK